ncbi:6-hydroxymethylpterin diphosphokinase MptE-like protein [Pseudoalteromonas sp. OOF1S-7]|uniref:motility associated factor glycosyltransferase family protein n=1 Tax=Pseudoalteromonas sp. OOF1S-7 TaxID=2917757 RepID=UPI001EF57E21|nr:6-hydroxymethylpterin diphosphokinase MptE-like protein [Pseudoalteromonas sp. OOF1S-7]MCG7537119.1 DUF115 domain-containing protein [Pseudoalteromonas sp. OOF1S-7]
MKQDSFQDQIKSLDEKLTETLEHQKRETKFAEQANVRFEKNLACFEHYFPDIANTIVKHQVRSDFCIHVTKTGEGNFVPKGFDAPIYSQDPIEQTKEQVQCQIDNPVFSLTDYTGYPINDTDDRIHIRYMSKLSKFMKRVRSEQAQYFDTLPDTFPSAIIFGIGLGYHVPMLMEHTRFDYTFLIEPDFEQFYASLFCTDWFTVIEKIDEQGGCLFFHLGATSHSFIQDLEKIAEDVGAFSIVRSFCYQHTPDADLNVLIKKWTQEYFRFQYGHGFYNDAITGLAHSILHIENQVPVLTGEAKQLDYDTPVFIIGNGPSLDDAEHYIKQNQGKAIIVAAGTAVASLFKKGIQTDFHVLVERPLHNHKIFERILSKEEYAKINLLGLNTVYPQTNDRYLWSGIAVKGNEAGTSLMDLLNLQSEGKTLPKIPYCNPLVANAALSFFLHMGYRNIYLFGIDNGSAPDGAHHSRDSIYKVRNDDDSEGIPSIPIKGKTIEGNLGGVVVSNNLFMVAHAQLEKLVSHYNASSVFNVGRGAKIKHAIPLAVENLLDIETSLNKPEKIEFIKAHFFSVWDIEEVDDKLIAADKLEQVCDHLISIAQEPISDRSQGLENLRRQSRYLYSIRDTALGHLFHAIKGSMLYYHCPLITLLYSYSDEHFTLEQFSGLNALWVDYLREIKQDYRISCRKACDWAP